LWESTGRVLPHTKSSGDQLFLADESQLEAGGLEQGPKPKGRPTRQRKIIPPTRITPKTNFMLGAILLVVLILMILGALPHWPHSRSWGYYPSSGLGLLLVILIILLLLGRI